MIKNSNSIVFYLKNFILSIIDAYAVVIFGKSKIVGLIILVATFTVPLIGFAGLMGTIFALLFARLFALESWDNKSGLLVFNALLVGLGFGANYPFETSTILPFLFGLAISSVIAVLLYVFVNHISLTYLKLPSLTLSFSLTALSILLFWHSLGNSLPYQSPKPFYELRLNDSSGFWTGYFQSVGGIFFFPYTLAGILITIAMLVSSRIKALLSLSGFAIVWILYQNFSPASSIVSPGLNAILIAITVGGILLVPSKSSYLLAVIATVVGVIIFESLRMLFSPYGAPPYTFPFVFTVFVVIYPLSLRLKNETPYLIDFGTYHPEENLIAYYSRSKRFYQADSPQFYLPVVGEWRVTQGNLGDITHKYQWAYAWDFEIFDNQNVPYSTITANLNNSDFKHKPESYYAFGKPVLASADGYVAKVIDGIADNPIGQINTNDNWGNVVTIYHNNGIYTLYGHLKKDSIKVKEGDYVKKGDKIAAVGNSGRSAVPHLHFNVQLGAEPGANTIKSFIANFKQRINSDYRFHPFAIPSKGDLVAPLIPTSGLQDILHLKVNDSNTFKVSNGKEGFFESWTITTDFFGRLFIESDRGSRLEFSFYDGIYNLLSFNGKKHNALFAFAAIVSRFPYQENVSLLWEDESPLAVFIPCCVENLLLLVHSLARIVTITNSSSYEEQDDSITITTATMRSLFRKKSETFKGTVNFSKFIGIEKIDLFKDGKPYLSAVREKPPHKK